LVPLEAEELDSGPYIAIGVGRINAVSSPNC